MSHIHLTNFIKAPAKRVFDLSRSVDLHKISTAFSNEKAIAGITTGLINIDETVTWQANHLFKIRKFTSKIVHMESPQCFIDQMITGDFKSFSHQHHFKQVSNGTIMIDVVDFQSPYGTLGKFLNKIYLKNYIENLLIQRNKIIKEYAESNKWIEVLR